MGTPQALYVPLTVGAMLFLVNGIVKRAHVYNTLLGVALSGVIVFDHDGGASILHIASAAAFFGGNVLVMMFFSSKPRLLKAAFAATIVTALALWYFTGWFTLFWAEWVSLGIIAAHFILDSVSWSHYRAAGRRPARDPRTT